MFSSRTRSSVRLKDPKPREDSNVGGGGGAGAFTRWLREFRRETYKVNAAGGVSGGGVGGGTYHSTVGEDSRRRHSFNAHDKSAQHRADQRLQLQGNGGGLHASPASKTQPCRRANSTVVPKSRTRNDGLFTKANCSAVATIRELPSSKENRSSHGNNGVVKSGRVTTRMTETCDGHIPRHRAPLPPLEVKDVVCGHEKFPSCPAITAAATTVKSNGMSVTASRKSWAEEQTVSSSNSYPKEQPPPIVRPYPKRLSNGLYTQQLKTVMERCEKGKPELLDRVRSMRTKNGGGGYVERLQQPAEKHFCVPLSSIALDSVDPKSQLTQAQLEKYSRAYDDSPHRETDEYSSCFDGSDSALSSHLTKEELEHYTRIYEEKSTSQISLTEKTAPSHQHQTSYAQSEGYHSYVSSTDSTSTPFLDRLRRDSESAVVIVTSKDSEKPVATITAQGRDSSASSGSSSETLKWHGSNSDLSTVSSSGHRGTTQLIAHSAKVSAPQRHHSESVLSVTDGWSGVSVQEHRVGNQRNLRKLFPVSTYTVQPAMVVDEKTSPKSPPALTVAERINELEKQQQQQQQQQQQLQQTPNKFTYFDPEKKHRVADHSLRAIQKRALLSFYERHQPGSSWRSEPQLSPPPPRPPPIPCRPRLPTPLSRRSSISSEYDTPATWNDDCSKDDSSVEETSNANSKELNKNNPLRSSSCGSLSTAILGPMVLGPSISIDDWVPELPPKKKQVARQQTPQAKREPSPDLPPPPPVVDDDEQMFVSDEPLPPPPPEAIWPKPESLRNDKFLRNGKEKRLESSFSAVEDVLLSRDFNAGCGGVSAGLFNNNNHHLNGHQYQHQHNAMSEKSKSLSYIYDSHKAVPQTPVKSFAIELLQPPLLPPPPTSLLTSATTTDDKPTQFPHNSVKEFGRSSSVRRNKLTIPNKDYCKSEFSARKSVFQGSAVPKQQVVMSTVKPPAFSATITTVQSNVVKHQICTPLKIARDIDKKAAVATARSPSATKTVAVVGPLKSSGAFPPSLEPSCPPTLYQQSQSKASYLSAYKREPREREKGLPNFEGSYKRTASPNNGGRGDAAAAVEPQDVENVAPDGNDCCSNLLDSGGGRLQSLQLDHHHHHLHHFNNNNNNNNNNTATSQQQSSPSKQQAIDAMVTPPSPPPPTVLSERPVVDQSPQQQQQLSKTLPRANNSVGQDFKRSSRTPRTQSDPSNMPNKADSAITTLQLMMMPPPRHSESASSLHLQKRSQSDLSQVGSTESGYSSLSLNAPSPSHSPTRLSSGDFSSGGPAPPLLINSPSVAGAGAATTVSDLDECCTSTWHTAEPAVAVTTADHRYRNPVSRSCSTVSSDAASQTDIKSVAGGTPLAVRRKSPEEIECEELSRDLISHLSPSDKLHNILAPGPDVKRSTDYVSPLFRMDLVPRSRNSVAEKPIDCSSIDVTCGSNTSTISTSSSTTAAGLSANSSYYTTSEPKAKLLNLQHYSRQIQPPVECNGIGNLQKKKADLVSRLDRKLKVLRDEQIALTEEAALNENLGISVADRVKSVAKPQEANKFKTHVQEVGHITSLLLSLSGRLARAENALLDLDADHPEKKALEEKKCKLTGQLEEAKELKENIDRRGDFVSTILSRYLTADEYSDYDHFIAMKAKLLIDAREIADKIQLGEEQLRALKETLED